MLSELERRQVAGAAGVNEKAVQRLFGSVRALDPKVAGTSPQRRELELGFYLGKGELRAGRKDFLERYAAALRDYVAACPVVVGWIGRGDFKADRPPASITRPRLLHACRTVGRLRAALYRSIVE